MNIGTILQLHNGVANMVVIFNGLLGIWGVLQFLRKEAIITPSYWGGLALSPIWPADRPHLPIAEIEEWFASYVYLPKVRDRVVLEMAIRDAVSQFDPKFGFAEGYNAATSQYTGLVWAKAPPDFLPQGALLVSEEAVRAQPSSAAPAPGTVPAAPDIPGTSPGSTTASKPTRFFGAVEIDPTRPVKSFDAILSAIVTELQRTPGTKVKLVLEIEAQADAGFDDADVGVVRDNARQLKFKTESTGFGS